MTISDASSGHHSLTLNKKSLYLTTFACQFGRYRLIRLPFGVDHTGDMLQRTIYEVFREVISRGVESDPKKLCSQTEMSPTNKKELYCFYQLQRYVKY